MGGLVGPTSDWQFASPAVGKGLTLYAEQVALVSMRGLLAGGSEDALPSG